MPPHTGFEELRDRVLARIRPQPEEERELREAIRTFVALLASAAGRLGLDVEPFPGGSTAKGTYLRGDYDVDLFLRFAPHYDDASLSDLLGDILHAAGVAAKRVHGSRDYFQVVRGKCTFEIVPVCRIDDPRQARNVTDISPLHVAYTKGRLARNPRLRDEIRLAKQFCKAARCYGAESYVGGFSGHVLDLLVLDHGGFLQFLVAAADWPAAGSAEKVVIDPEGHHADPLVALNAAKIFSPLVIVDPVQPERNAAAALTAQKYDVLRAAAWRFLARPSLSAFTVRRLTPATLARRAPADRSIIIELESLEGKKDVVGAKCQKAIEHVRKRLTMAGFTVAVCDWGYDHAARRAIALFIVEETRLPATVEMLGPPMSARKNAQRFREKHGALGHEVVVKDGKLSAIAPRPWRTFRQAVAALLQDPYVTKRVVSARVLRSIN